MVSFYSGFVNCGPNAIPGNGTLAQVAGKILILLLDIVLFHIILLLLLLLSPIVSFGPQLFWSLVFNFRSLGIHR